MANKTHILIRQSAAALFLLLFIAVQVIKSSHTHEYLVKKDVGHYSISTVTHPCPICDFDFAKDKDFACQSFDIVPPPVVITGIFQHPQMLITSIGTTSAGRGPPVSFFL
ncbi:hypothetical protein [Ferruginibacter sp. HRS2-29]|uniref:hypothetical protein n=1 Tax=Ferruginibacter sp. HRS2-29 TaxID=2487334 RepID=UPI0020CF637D|nr:hypothetical protein [Ferruginibacter sp. HRS2-29]MCP9751990.1 hypothetical protein [Ferruginibacter sp. HRS2-29]